MTPLATSYRLLAAQIAQAGKPFAQKHWRGILLGVLCVSVVGASWISGCVHGRKTARADAQVRPYANEPNYFLQPIPAPGATVTIITEKRIPVTKTVFIEKAPNQDCKNYISGTEITCPKCEEQGTGNEEQAKPKHWVKNQFGLFLGAGVASNFTGPAPLVGAAELSYSSVCYNGSRVSACLTGRAGGFATQTAITEAHVLAGLELRFH